jgi:hypothetical protein
MDDNKKIMTVYLPGELKEQAAQLSGLSSMPMSKLGEYAMRDFLANVSASLNEEDSRGNHYKLVAHAIDETYPNGAISI